MFKKKDRKLFVFDLDKTLLTKNISVSFGFFLFKRRFLSLRSYIYCLLVYYFYVIGIFDMKRVHNLIFKRVFFKKSVNILHDYLKKFVKYFWNVE